MNISITADKVSISLTNPAPVVSADVISTISVQQPSELEWSETLLEGDEVDYEIAEKTVKALGPGWRIPTRDEELSIVDTSRHNPAIDTSRFPDTKSSPYWTSTPCAWNPEARWVVSFHHGFVYDFPQGYRACVRACRSVVASQ